MIPVRRGEEPEELRNERYWRAARAMVQHHRGIKPAKEQLTGYKHARERLLSAQNNKCAYCEASVREGAPVEHFRPKDVYFWLTWSWDNLFIACSTCNDPKHKGAEFELFDPSSRLSPGQLPPGDEQPKLLDPSDPTVQPVRHIEFKVVAGRWLPVARAGNLRGDATVRAFGLDVGPIVDHYESHIENLRPRINDVRAAIASGNPRAVSLAWDKLIGNAFSRRQQFHGLMYDVIASEIPEGIRAMWGLVLPEPGNNLPPDPPVQDRRVAAHEDLPERIVLEVRALGSRPGAVERDEVIAILCAHRPHTCAELAAILEREEDYLLRVLQALHAAGRLVFTQPHYHTPSAQP
ncbi:MAG: hypothetical protein R3B70_05645 [Polyangiaceae bacterium]